MKRVKIKETKKFLIVSFAILSFSIGGGIARAQSEAGQPGATASTDSVLTPEIEQAIDNYTKEMITPVYFSSGVQEIFPFYSDPFVKFNLELNSEKQTYEKGTTVKMAGTLSFSSQAKEEKERISRNCNNAILQQKGKCLSSPLYSVDQFSNLGLYVQVFRKDPNQKTSSNGDFLVDEFYAVENVALRENDKKGISFNWKLPEEIKDGDYYFSFIVNEKKSFDLWGTPLVAFSSAKTYNFQVNSGGNKGIEIDKDGLKLNKKDYFYRRPAPTVSADNNNQITAEIPINNLDQVDKNVKIKYNLYRWGQTNPADIVSNKQEVKTVPAGKKTVAQFSFEPNDLDSIYDLEITAATDTSRSVSNIRFVMTGKNRGTFRFLGIAKPEGKTDSREVMFCLRNANWEGIFEGKVAIELSDQTGKQLKNWEGNAGVKAETRCFTPKELKVPAEGCVNVKGQIFDKQNRLVDKKEVQNLCAKSQKEEKINPSKPDVGNGMGVSQDRKGFLLMIAAAAIVIAGLLYILSIKIRNGRK